MPSGLRAQPRPRPGPRPAGSALRAAAPRGPCPARPGRPGPAPPSRPRPRVHHHPTQTGVVQRGERGHARVADSATLTPQRPRKTDPAGRRCGVLRVAHHPHPRHTTTAPAAHRCRRAWPSGGGCAKTSPGTACVPDLAESLGTERGRRCPRASTRGSTQPDITRQPGSPADRLGGSARPSRAARAGVDRPSRRPRTAPGTPDHAPRPHRCGAGPLPHPRRRWTARSVSRS